MSQLREALGVGHGDVVSFVGAGGKTTAAMRLADELSAAGQKVIFTTTTKIMEPIPRADEYLIISDDAEDTLTQIPELLTRYSKILLAHHRLEESDPHIEGDVSYPFQVRTTKVKGMAAEMVDQLALRLAGQAVILVEADGARHCSLKAPAPHEPVVPESTTLVVPVASLHVLGKPLGDQHVFRPELVAALSGTSVGEPVTAVTVAAVLSHPEGGLKQIPLLARVVPILNQWEGDRGSTAAQRVAELVLCSERIERVVIASLRQADPVLDVVEGRRRTRRGVAAIVLAAGASTRCGQPKQLLPIGLRTMLQHVVDIVLNSSVDQTIVVLGHRADEIGATLGDRPVDSVVNEDWEAGLSASMQAGLRAIRLDAEAALFILADQPAITPEIIAALLQRYRETEALIVVPIYQGRQGNPVLFDRALFAELLEVRGDQGGRQLLDRYAYRIERVKMSSEAVLTDVDTQEDYDRFNERL